MNEFDPREYLEEHPEEELKVRIMKLRTNHLSSFLIDSELDFKLSMGDNKGVAYFIDIPTSDNKIVTFVINEEGYTEVIVKEDKT